MKKIFYVFFSLFVALFLAACSGVVEGKLEIQGIEGVSETDIDLEEGTIKFSVSSEISTFDVDNILVPANVGVEAYQDAAYTVSLGETLNLELGENVFYLKLTSMLFTDDWTMYITRLSVDAKAPKSITILSLDSTYGLNEDFGNGILLVIYNDGTREEITITPDMIKGFDTNSLGSKTATISYKGLVTMFGYQVITDIKEISISEQWAHDYLMGSTSVYSDGLLNVVLTDGSTIEVEITQNMVSQFDTSTPGSKELIVTYKGMTAKFGYVVHEKYSEVKIVNLKETYTYGEQLRGSIKFVLGDYEFTKPLKDYAKGYDAYTYGIQTIYVPEFNLTATVRVVEKESYGDFNAPEASTVTFDDFKEIYAIIMAIGESEHFQGAEFDKYYNEYYNEVVNEEEQDEVMDVLRKCGFSKLQFEQVASLYRKKAAPLLESYNESSRFNSFSDLLSEISVDDIQTVQSIIEELLYIVEPNQISLFIYETTGLSGHSSYGGEYPMLNENMEYEYISHSEFMDSLSAVGYEKVVNFLEKVRNSDADVDLTVSDIHYIVERVYTVAEAFVDVEANDLHDILTYVLDLITEDFEIDDLKDLDQDKLLSMVHKAADVLETLLIDTGLLEDSQDFLSNIIDEVLIYNNEYDAYLLIKDVFSLISMYGDDVIYIAQDLNKDELTVIVDALVSLESELTKEEKAKLAVKVAKIIKPIIDNLDSNEEAKDMIVYILSDVSSDTEVYSIISKAVMWTLLDANKLTKDEVEDINKSIDSVMDGNDYLDVYRTGYDVSVPQGASVEEVLKELKNKYEVYYEGENNRTPIQLTTNTVKGIDTTTKGWHTVQVFQEGITVELHYYVYDKNASIEITGITDSYYMYEYLFYFDLNSTKPYEYARNKYSINENYSNSTAIEDIIDRIGYKYLIKDAGVESRGYMNIENVEFVVDTTSTGLKLGYLYYNASFGEIYIPFQCYVYDSKNPNIDQYDKTIYVEQNGSYYQEAYLVVDFGRETKQIAIMIDPYLTENLGTYTLTFEGVDFVVHVVEYEELKKLKRVNYLDITFDISDPENTYKLGDFRIGYDTKGDKDNYNGSYQSFISNLEYMYENPSIVFDWGTYILEEYELYRYVDVNYTIYDGSTIVYQGVAEGRAVATDRFNDCSYYIYNNHSYESGYSLLVDSYDDVTLEKLLSVKTIEKSYTYQPGYDYITAEQFLNEVSLTYELENEYEYYRIYTIRYNNGSYNSSTEVRVVLNKNKDVIERREISFDWLKIINIPTEEELVQEIQRNLQLREYKVTGAYETLTDEEAVAILNAGNPSYYFEITGNEIRVEVQYTLNGELHTNYVYGDFYVIDETTTVETSGSKELYVYSLDKDELINQIINSSYYFYFDTPSNGQSFSLRYDELISSHFEIITDLSNISSGDTFELECTYYGAKLSFLVTYYA